MKYQVTIIVKEKDFYRTFIVSAKDSKSAQLKAIKKADRYGTVLGNNSALVKYKVTQL